MLSTLHPDVKIDWKHKKKLPETVEFYNKTKCGVDIVDQMVRKYSVQAALRRWPVHIFYNVQDLAGINTFVIYQESIDKNFSKRNVLF